MSFLFCHLERPKGVEKSKKTLYLFNYNIFTMNTKNINQMDSLMDYQSPSFMVVYISPEGVLCESGSEEERDIDNFVVLPETDW